MSQKQIETILRETGEENERLKTENASLRAKIPAPAAATPASKSAALWDEYRKLPITERNAFYKANEDAMS